MQNEHMKLSEFMNISRFSDDTWHLLFYNITYLLPKVNGAIRWNTGVMYGTETGILESIVNNFNFSHNVRDLNVRKYFGHFVLCFVIGFIHCSILRMSK